MTEDKEWPADLMKEVSSRKERVRLLKQRAPMAMYNLRLAVVSAADAVNQKLSNEDADFVVSELEDNHSFEIEDANGTHQIEINFDPEEESLEYELEGYGTVALNAMPDKDGGISFFERGNKLVTYEQLSQRLVELLVREVFRLPIRIGN